MQLENMTREDLHRLRTVLRGLTQASNELASMGCEPIFDLTPGQDVRIFTGLVLFGAEVATAGNPDVEKHEVSIFDEPAIDVQDIARQVANEFWAVPPAPQAAEPALVLQDHAAQQLVAGVPVAVAAPRPDARPLPTPPPVAVAAPDGDGLTRGPWTKAEESRAVWLRQFGLKLPEIAELMGRPATATAQKFKADWRDWESRPGFAGRADQWLCDVVGVNMASDMDAAVTYRDAEMIRMATEKWPLDQIAADLGMPEQALKSRFDLLTNARNYPRAEVLDALRSIINPPEIG